jgi:biopolymer transport protein ExbD/biopolymer transport protein TolR
MRRWMRAPATMPIEPLRGEAGSPFGRLAATRAPRQVAEINMTPLIDVVLVLLVIFMMAAPLMAGRLALDLPRAAGADAAPAPAVLRVALDATGQLFVDAMRSDAQALRQRAARAARENPDTEVQLRADQRVPYGRVAELIGLVREAGLTRIGLVTEEPPETAPARAQPLPTIAR